MAWSLACIRVDSRHSACFGDHYNPDTNAARFSMSASVMGLATGYIIADCAPRSSPAPVEAVSLLTVSLLACPASTGPIPPSPRLPWHAMHCRNTFPRVQPGDAAASAICLAPSTSAIPPPWVAFHSLHVLPDTLIAIARPVCVVALGPYPLSSPTQRQRRQR